MSTRRELNIKPSCAKELMAFPKESLGPLLEKINLLVEDPVPDGKLKKQLQDRKDVSRLRVGHWRVFYTFGESWVRLLGIRKRDEHTYSGRTEADQPAWRQDQEEMVAGDTFNPDQQPAARRHFDVKAPDLPPPLPRPLTVEWLRELGVAPQWFPALSRVRSEDDLLAVALPDEVVSLILDGLYPARVVERRHEPDLVVQSPGDLVRYREGELLAFLLRLDPDQQKLASWALRGPTLVKGGAGTGKSTVALHRVRELLGRKGGSSDATVLFSTYTRALKMASEQLLDQLLSPEQRRRVRVATCDEIAVEMVRAGAGILKVEGDEVLKAALRDIRRTFQPDGPSSLERRLRQEALSALSDDYLFDEFTWIIDGRGIESLTGYLETPRPGRGIRFGPKLREGVWQLYSRWRSQTEGVLSFGRVRRLALERVQSGEERQRYDHVLIDEAQDLPPTALALLVELARTAEGVFLAADTRQSIYSRDRGWQTAHPRLQFQGRTAVLRKNYRSTGEIEAAASGILTPSSSEDVEHSNCVHEGPLPVLLRGCLPAETGRWIGRFIWDMARHLHVRPSTAAVLVPDQTTGELIAEQLVKQGMNARFFAGRDLDLRSEAVKVLTWHSAKGLEFPVVAVAFSVRPPSAGPVEVGEQVEQEEQVRRLLYVACTRAMRGLMLVQPVGSSSPALPALAEAGWNIQEVG